MRKEKLKAGDITLVGHYIGTIETIKDLLSEALAKVFVRHSRETCPHENGERESIFSKGHKYPLLAYFCGDRLRGHDGKNDLLETFARASH